MARITYLEHTGTAHVVEVADGLSVMEGAIRNGLPGLDGQCGGNAACATCHVFVPAGWQARLGRPGDLEQAMLEMARGFKPEASRLACQLRVSPALDGLVVTMAQVQG